MTEDSNPIETALTWLQGFLQCAGMDARVEATSDPAFPDSVTLSIEGPDAGYLAGPRGQSLEGLQVLMLAALRITRDARPRLNIDADRYRAKRAAALARFALQLADQVAATGEEAVTDPLNPLERRIFHTALIDHPLVETYSEGLEPERYVVVTVREEKTD